MKISNWIKTLGDLLYPANKVVVSAPVTTDYTATEVGDTMQDITNKVAGLQDDVIMDVEVTENVASVEIDLSHLHINARSRIKVESYLIFVDELGDAVDDRVVVRVNDFSGGV